MMVVQSGSMRPRTAEAAVVAEAEGATVDLDPMCKYGVAPAAVAEVVRNTEVATGVTVLAAGPEDREVQAGLVAQEVPVVGLAGLVAQGVAGQVGLVDQEVPVVGPVVPVVDLVVPVVGLVVVPVGAAGTEVAEAAEAEAPTSRPRAGTIANVAGSAPPRSASRRRPRKNSACENRHLGARNARVAVPGVTTRSTTSSASGKTTVATPRQRHPRMLVTRAKAATRETPVTRAIPVTRVMPARSTQAEMAARRKSTTTESSRLLPSKVASRSVL